MPLEIERKFLVKGQPWLTWSEGKDYRQGYLSKGLHTITRIRVAGTQGYITIKGKADGISRTEFEYTIPATDALELLEMAEGAIIHKTRYIHEYQGHCWEVDVFHGDNQGLVVAEIELQSVDEDFTHPPWLGDEVSDDYRYSNASLSRHPWRNC